MESLISTTFRFGIKTELKKEVARKLLFSGGKVGFQTIE